MKKTELKTLLAKISDVATRQDRASDNKKYLVWDLENITELALKNCKLQRATSEQIAKAITERVAKRIQGLQGQYGRPASLNLKAAIFHEVLSALENGVES